jgi:hypothetical protein
VLVAVTVQTPASEGAVQVTDVPESSRLPQSADQSTSVDAVVPDTAAVKVVGCSRKTVTVAGSTDTVTGVTVTEAEADFEGSSTLVAVTEYEPPATGAVHVTEAPEPETSPPDAAQVTAGFEAFDTVAVKVADPAAPTVCDDDETATWTGSESGVGSVPPSPPQAAAARATMMAAASRLVRKGRSGREMESVGMARLRVQGMGSIPTRGEPQSEGSPTPFVVSPNSRCRRRLWGGDSAIPGQSGFVWGGGLDVDLSVVLMSIRPTAARMASRSSRPHFSAHRVLP